MRARITRRSIAGMIPPEAGQLWLHDADLPGFMVLCQASGRRTYVVRYSTAAGAPRKLTIGNCAELSPEDARERARDVLAIARRGEDPKRDRAAPTVADLCKRFTDEHAARLKPGTAANYEILWRRHILPRIGSLRVLDLKRRDIAALHDAMRATPVNANRALEVLSKSLNMAEVWGWRDEGTNPCRHVTAYREQHRQRTLTDDEVARLWQVLDAYAAEQTVPAAEAIKLALLTGCRKGEWLRSTWRDLDADRGVLHLPDSKTGARDVHLPDEALAILADLPRVSVYILPGRTGGPIGGLQKIWERLRDRAGLPGVRLHDLRHTVGSLSDREGMSLRQIADLLGHAQTSTTQRYVNSADEHKRQTAAGWAAVVTRITRKR